MKILTWNINGIRAVQQRDNIGLKKLLDSLEADVICFQETKVTRDMLDEPIAIVENYDSFFGFSRKKTGYSGTANFCRNDCTPLKAEEGLTDHLTSQADGAVGHYCEANCFTSEELNALDEEGRCVITQHQIRLPDDKVTEVAIINVYVPRAGDREERLEYKLKFLTLLQLRAEELLRSGVHVIVLGDINTTHTNKDHCDPQSNEEYIRRSSRIWMNQFLQISERDSSIPKTDGRFADLPEAKIEGGHFSDVYRRLHPDVEGAYTNWCTLTGARQTNYGRRLDYILVDKQLAQYTKDCQILADVHGSDHCPVVITLDCCPLPSSVCPPLCSKFMPEFRGQQKKLSAFFSKASKSNSKDHVTTTGDKSKNEIIVSSPGKKRFATSLPQSSNSLKQSNLLKEHSQGKKARLKKEDSKQSSLKFFYETTSKPRSPQKTMKSESIRLKEQTFDEHQHSVSIELKNGHEVMCIDDKTLHSNSKIEFDSSNYSTLTSTSESLQAVSPSKTSLPTAPISTLNSSAQQAWKNLLGGLPPPPLCSGHSEPSVLRTVKKEGPNKNKQFYVCCRPDGAPGNPHGRCDFFQWLTIKKR